MIMFKLQSFASLHCLTVDFGEDGLSRNNDQFTCASHTEGPQQSLTIITCDFPSKLPPEMQQSRVPYGHLVACVIADIVAANTKGKHPR